MKQVRKATACECGLPGANCKLRQHQFSVYHRRHEKITRLLANESLSFAEIGRRLGISRERVRQVARQLGQAPQRQRIEQRIIEKRMSAWHKRPDHRKLIAKCQELGYTAEPSRRDAPYGWSFEAGVVVINGWLTHIVHVSPKGRYLVFKRSPTRVNREDFHIGISPIGFFVFPAAVWKTFPGATAFSPAPCASGQRGFTHSGRHDYLSYLEAWKLLDRRR
jgi:Sigma-70, region 4